MPTGFIKRAWFVCEMNKLLCHIDRREISLEIKACFRLFGVYQFHEISRFGANDREEFPFAFFALLLAFFA